MTILSKQLSGLGISTVTMRETGLDENTSLMSVISASANGRFGDDEEFVEPSRQVMGYLPDFTIDLTSQCQVK